MCFLAMGTGGMNVANDGDPLKGDSTVGEIGVERLQARLRITLVTRVVPCVPARKDLLPGSKKFAVVSSIW